MSYNGFITSEHVKMETSLELGMSGRLRDAPRPLEDRTRGHRRRSVALNLINRHSLKSK